jgi:hypothetical protein
VSINTATGPPDLGSDAADLRHNRADPIVPRMAHVQPENVCSLQHQLAHHLRAFRCRAECADDFCAAHNRFQTSGCDGKSKGRFSQRCRNGKSAPSCSATGCTSTTSLHAAPPDEPTPG